MPEPIPPRIRPLFSSATDQLKFSVAAVFDVFKERDLGDAKTYNGHGKRWRAKKRLSLINSENRGKRFYAELREFWIRSHAYPRGCKQAVKYSRAKSLSGVRP